MTKRDKQKKRRKKMAIFGVLWKKKKFTPEKKRSTYLTFDFGEPTAVDKCEIDRQTGEARLFRSGKRLIPKEARLETSYDRNKGPKVISNIPIHNQNVFYVNLKLNLMRYDRIFVIDTNTKKVNNIHISVACYGYIRIIKFDSDNVIGQYGVLKCFEFRNPKANEEKIAWRKGIEDLINSPGYSNKFKIGIVIDCDLDNIKKYNSREIPIIEKFYLPENFTLIYASSERGKEYLPNRAISACDKEAKRLLSYIYSNLNDNENLREVVGFPYSHIRMWESIIEQNKS